MLESSEYEFGHRFSKYAAHGLLYPQTEGSPLLEFATHGQVLYLFDRCGPYAAHAGQAMVVIHGILDAGAITVLDPSEALAAGEELSHISISSLEGLGQLLLIESNIWVVQAKVPLVLGSFDPLPKLNLSENQSVWVRFKTLPPLHGFILN